MENRIPTTEQTAIPAKKKSKLSISNPRTRLFLIAIPFLIYFIAFNYVPLFGWIYSFFNYKPGLHFNQLKFEGLDNYIQIFTGSSDVIRVVRNTLVMSFIGIVGQPLPVIFAILINEIKSKKFSKFVQTTSTLPNFISWIIVFSMAFSIFSIDGVLNTIIGKLGLEQYTMTILGNRDAVWIFQWALGVWKTVGWSSIIYLAAIAGIDQEQYEAATIDGAGRLSRIWNITLPGVIPTFLVLFILSISNILNLGMDQHYVFYNPMVAETIETLDYYVYRMGIMLGDYSFATAVGIIKAAISLVLLFLANKVIKRFRDGNAII